MFRGRSIHSLDAKGRIRIPPRFRDILRDRYDDRLVVTNLDRCLIAYPLPEWERIEEKLGGLSLVRQDVKAFQRFFLSGATDCSFDGQGRILIPQTLRDHARLEREVVLAGMTRSFEIWSKHAFAVQNLELLPDIELADLRRVEGEQEIMVRYAPQRALETLPALVRAPADRKKLMTLLERALAFQDSRGAWLNDEQRGLLGRIVDALAKPVPRLRLAKV